MTAVRKIEDRNRVVSLGNQMFEQIGTSKTYNADLDVQGDIGRGFSVLANWGYADSYIPPVRADGTPQANANRRSRMRRSTQPGSLSPSRSESAT